MNLEQFASFVLNAYYINVSVKFDDFFLTAKEKKPIHVPIVENIPSLERAQCAFLDHSETEKALFFPYANQTFEMLSFSPLHFSS